jgi:3-isopropylmalate/(R)-2-methylmalate dehydratase small subunit
MNRDEHRGAHILLAGRNFGCGSSREHAPWALQDAGFEVIIAPSFADIFRANCASIGVLAVDLDESLVRALFERVAQDPSWRLTVDLERLTLTGDSFDTTFEVDPHVRYRLLEGLDAIDLSLRHDNHITDFERNRPPSRPTMAI